MRWIFMMAALLMVAPVAQAQEPEQEEQTWHDLSEGTEGFYRFDEWVYRFPAPDPANEEKPPYDNRVDQEGLVNLTLDRARLRDVPALLVFGANWCHDSRGLARKFVTNDDLARILRDHYEVAYLNVGVRTENHELISRFGVDGVVGTPTLVIVAPDGTVLNSATTDDFRATNRAADSDIEAYLSHHAGLEVSFDVEAVASVDMDTLAENWSSYQSALSEIDALVEAGEMDEERANYARRVALGLTRSVIRLFAGMAAGENEDVPVAMLSDLEGLGIEPAQDMTPDVEALLSGYSDELVIRMHVDEDQTRRALAGEVGYPDDYRGPGYVQPEDEETSDEADEHASEDDQ